MAGLGHLGFRELPGWKVHCEFWNLRYPCLGLVMLLGR